MQKVATNLKQAAEVVQVEFVNAKVDNELAMELKKLQKVLCRRMRGMILQGRHWTSRRRS